MAFTGADMSAAVEQGVRGALSQFMQAGGPTGGIEGSAHRNGSGSGGWRRQLDYKGLDGLPIYRGGEVDWVDWSWKVKVALEPMAGSLVELMDMAEKNRGLGTSALMQLGDPDELGNKYGGVVQGSSELYSVLVRFTEGEAATVVKGIVERDGLLAWGTMHARYSRRTLGRMFRIQKECMYPKQARNIREVGSMILEWEGKWTRMMAELGQKSKPRICGECRPC